MLAKHVKIINDVEDTFTFLGDSAGIFGYCEYSDK